MCGFTGFISFRERYGKDLLISMTDVLYRRGPDDSGIEMFTTLSAQIGLGFRRLSIIDLSKAGHQPMNSLCGKFWIMLNGEIYNYAEIRSILEKAGHQFQSASDTEVAMVAYKEWGLECVHRFTGMFAMLIYDVQLSMIHLIRDRAGVKPLYYYRFNDTFLFGSELKSFHEFPDFEKTINADALALFFRHGYIPAPYTIYANACKVMPGEIISIDTNNNTLTKKKYWDVVNYYNKPKFHITYEDAMEQLEQLLRKSFSYRLIADVPVGVFLSGGYDSSLVTALLQQGMTSPLKTFTIGFGEKNYDEAPFARKIANHLGTEHTEYQCSFTDAMDVIPMLPEMYDEPMADSSAIPTYLVSKIARESVTVALSADGGDETFAGYTKYGKALNYINRFNSFPGWLTYGAAIGLGGIESILGQKSLSTANRLDKLICALKEKNTIPLFNIITQDMTHNEIRSLFRAEVKFPDTFFNRYESLQSKERVDQFLCLDYKTYLSDDIMTKVDRAGMYNSLESREPLLDHHIIEYVAQLPIEYKLHQGITKRILKDITHRYIPQPLIERPKMGFRIPIEKWMNKELKHYLVSYINKESLEKHGLFDWEKVNQMLTRYLNNKDVDFHRIWKLLVFQCWYERWN